MKSTTQAADQALLMAERGMFLANRIPFLLRQQMRVGSREILGDALNMVGSTEAIVTRAKELEPIVEQLPPLVATSADAAHEARLLVEEVEPLVPTREAADRIERTLESANSLTERTSTLLGELRAAASEDSPLRRLAGRFDAALARGLGFLVLLGAAWSAMWWGGYVLAKRAVNRRAASAPS